jgi:hypothetical protein
MNIFYLSSSVDECARWTVDRHVVKMITEGNQILSTAHRYLDGEIYLDKTSNGRSIKRWRLPDAREEILYKASHINHPSTVWARTSNNNYTWLWCLTKALCEEYTYRYGRRHKGEDVLEYLRPLPRNIPVGYKTLMPCAMPEEYKISSDPIINYKTYYANAKSRLHSWKNRVPPDWIEKYTLTANG